MVWFGFKILLLSIGGNRRLGKCVNVIPLFDEKTLFPPPLLSLFPFCMSTLGAIQIIRDTLGGGGGFETVSPNDTWGGRGLAKVSHNIFSKFWGNIH